MKSSVVSIAISVASPGRCSRTGRQKVPTPGPYSTNSLVFFQSTGRSMWRISVGVEADDRGPRAVVGGLLHIMREHEILAVDEDTHQQREEQRQHQRHFDDGGAALLARQGKVCLANVADAPRKYAGTGHAARMARANESGVEKTRRRLYVFCGISPRVTSRQSAAKRPIDRKSTRLNSSH